MKKVIYAVSVLCAVIAALYIYNIVRQKKEFYSKIFRGKKLDKTLEEYNKQREWEKQWMIDNQKEFQ